MIENAGIKKVGAGCVEDMEDIGSAGRKRPGKVTVRAKKAEETKLAVSMGNLEKNMAGIFIQYSILGLVVWLGWRVIFK